VTEDWRKVCNEKLHYMYSSSYIKGINSSSMREVLHVARIVDEKFEQVLAVKT
jgi:hypothetical protein